MILSCKRVNYHILGHRLSHCVIRELIITLWKVDPAKINCWQSEIVRTATAPSPSCGPTLTRLDKHRHVYRGQTVTPRRRQ
ncbi:hypothetical protein J6590_006089 [Homalodisca vitripennis]|nr:hypothetical protein J6590_006089 [Homalodisca vitripennis]